jgi:hypothetical protein
MSNPKEEIGPITPGRLFVESINSLLVEQNDHNCLSMNPDSMAPIFDQTIEELRCDGKDLHAQTVFLTTILRLSDDLKAKKARFSGDYYILEGVRIELLGDISRYFKDHPDAREKFRLIEASY